MNKINITEEIKNLTKVDRIDVHSHITSLGLDKNLNPVREDGLIGQEKARKAAGIILKLVKDYSSSGKAILISGKGGTGKTALAKAMAKELGNDTPFVILSGCEIYSKEISKCEALTQAVRKSMGIKIREKIEIIEGEIAEIIIDKSLSGMTAINGKITLKTTDMESIYGLGEKMANKIINMGIQAGDIIRINKSNGSLVKLGRSLTKVRKFDSSSNKVPLIPCPDGEIQKTIDDIHMVSFHEIDVINSQTNGVMALFSGDTGEISEDIRDKVDMNIAEWRDHGKAEIVPGILFIDEVDMLDLECFSYLNRILENPIAPLIAMATNKEKTFIRGGPPSMIVPYGIPTDFSERTLVIKTFPLKREEIFRILKLRAAEEDINISNDALEALSSLGNDLSLRYSMQILTLSYFCSLKDKKEILDLEDVKRGKNLFMDEKSSSKFCMEENGLIHS